MDWFIGLGGGAVIRGIFAALLATLPVCALASNQSRVAALLAVVAGATALAHWLVSYVEATRERNLLAEAQQTIERLRDQVSTLRYKCAKEATEALAEAGLKSIEIVPHPQKYVAVDKERMSHS